MGITTTTEYGRAKINWPDFGHDGGSSLHTKITDAVGEISNNLIARYSGVQTLADTASYVFTHDFNLAIDQLSIFIYESNTLLNVAVQSSNYLITETSANVINIQNISGGSKTFYAYIIGYSINAVLGRVVSNIATTDGTQTTCGTITIPTNTAAIITALISARKDGSIENIYELKFAANNNSGTVAVAQMSKTQLEDDSDWDVTIDASGATARVRVTGETATNIAWTANITTNYI